MITLTSSNSSAKYIRDVLAAAAYPKGHVLRLRYDKRYVQQSLRLEKISKLPTRKALIVFAETDDPSHKFCFIPVREAKIIRWERAGSAFLIDVSLGDYPSLDDSRVAAFNATVMREGKRFPLPRPKDSVGLGWSDINGTRQVRAFSAGDWAGDFVQYQGDLPALVTNTLDSRESWQSVVAALAKSSLGVCPFFAIREIHRRRITRFPFIKARVKENPVLPKSRWPEVEYKLSSGSQFVIEIDTYHPAISQPFRIDVSHSGDGIAGIVPDSITIDSRYDVCRLMIATRRLLEDVLSPITVSATPVANAGATVANPWDQNAPYTANELMPRLIFSTRVGVSGLQLVVAFFLISASVLLLAASAGLWKSVAAAVESLGGPSTIACFIEGESDLLAVVSRVVGAFTSVGISLLILRKTKFG